MAENITFASKTGAETSGAIALPPGDGKAPGLVLIQEWWGLNDHIRSLVDRFAAAGFITLAPDLYHGKSTPDPNEAAKLMTALDGDRSIEEIAGAVSYLQKHARSNGKVGITGFCMGGAFSFRAATTIPELAAAVPFYGIPPAEKSDYSKVTAPIMAHFASRDQFVDPAKAEAIKKQLDARGQSMELFIYDADHAFMNDSRPDVYNAEAAKLAWDRTIAFLQKHLATP